MVALELVMVPIVALLAWVCGAYLLDFLMPFFFFLAVDWLCLAALLAVKAVLTASD